MIKIGLALSGGGIKAFSQLPVLATLAKEKINIDAISGTSMGSVIAALFASGVTAEAVMQAALDLEKEIEDKKIMKRPSMKLLPFSKEKLTGGFVDGQDLEDVLEAKLIELGVEHIRDVKIPLAITAVDVITGKKIMFVSHPEDYVNKDPDTIVITDISLAKAVRASCSFPFVIAAMEYEDYLLVDGGLRQNLPLEPLYNYGVDKTIAVTMHSTSEFHDTNSLVALGIRVMDIMRIEADQEIVHQADVHINVPLDKVWVFEIGKGKYTIDQGAHAISEHIDQLKGLTKPESFMDKLRRKFK